MRDACSVGLYQGAFCLARYDHVESLRALRALGAVHLHRRALGNLQSSEPTKVITY